MRLIQYHIVSVPTGATGESVFSILAKRNRSCMFCCLNTCNSSLLPALVRACWPVSDVCSRHTPLPCGVCFSAMHSHYIVSPPGALSRPIRRDARTARLRARALPSCACVTSSILVRSVRLFVSVSLSLRCIHIGLPFCATCHRQVTCCSR